MEKHLTLRISKLLIDEMDRTIKSMNKKDKYVKIAGRSEFLRYCLVKVIKNYWRKNK